MTRDKDALERRREVLKTARSVVGLPIHKRMSLAEKILDDFRANREATYARLAEWAGWWRDLLLVQSGAEDGVANADMMDELRDDARRFQQPEVLAFVRAILGAIERLRANVQPRPAIELLLLEAPESDPVSSR
jgi:DNA polymerase-3 subunit delta'